MNLFPFGQVAPGSRVILYGAGTAGQTFLAELEKTGYADVVAVADRDYDRYALDCRLIAPEAIRGEAYDVLVVTIDDPQVAQAAARDLSERCGVPAKRIVCAAGSNLVLRKVEKLPVAVGALAFAREERISLAFWLSNGLGDQIISKKVVTGIVSYLGAENCMVDLYVPPNGMRYVRAVFGDCPYIHAYIPGERQIFLWKDRYDVAICGTHRILTVYAKPEDVLAAKGERLCRLARMLVEKDRAYGLSYARHYDSFIHFERCKRNGWDMYSFFNYYGVLHFEDNRVPIPLSAEAEKVYEQLHLGRYLTLNYGWGSSANGDTTVIHAKAWPFSYYERLVALLHAAFPQVRIVQLGVATTPRMKGVDVCAFNQDIEVVKHILRHALVHVDCEGGLQHLATQLGTKCVVPFGPTPVAYFGYPQNINLTAGDCHDCVFLSLDLRTCARHLPVPECMQRVTPEMVCEAIQTYLAPRLEAGA